MKKEQNGQEKKDSSLAFIEENPKDIEIITDASRLGRAAEYLDKQSVLAVDVESDSMHHFREKVCLIQLASAEGVVFVVDPFKVASMEPLRSVLGNPKIQKIFHGADYDMRSLHRDFGIEVNHLFDTELACRFLGEHFTGLETVARNKLNVNLDKKYQKKDWAQRPLPIEMIRYAARDVEYLIPLAELLQTDLEKKGRLNWVREECVLLSRVRSPEPFDGPLFLKFRGAGRLDRRSLAVLEALLQFRLSVARKKDKPVFQIIGNQNLLRLATLKPMDKEQIQNEKILSSRQLDMYGTKILACIQKAMTTPQDELPRYPRMRSTQRISSAVSKRIRRIKAWRDEAASKLMIDPSLLMPKATVAAVAIHTPGDLDSLAEVEGLKTWQVREFGKDILKALSNGKRDRKYKKPAGAE